MAVNEEKLRLSEIQFSDILHNALIRPQQSEFDPKWQLS